MIARSNQALHIEELRELGVPITVQPEFEGGLEMVRQSLLRFGRDDAEARHLVNQQRASYYGILKA